MKFLILCALVGIAVAKVDYTGHQVYRAFPTPKQFEIIKAIGETELLDFWSDYKHADDFVDFRVPPELKPRIDVILARNRIPYDIFIEDIEHASNMQIQSRLPSLNGEFEYNKYQELDEIMKWISDFSSKSNFVTAINFGNSYEGRDITALKISTGYGRPAFVINCGLHSREWVSPATCINVADMLIKEYDTNSDVKDLMNSVDFYLIPVSNPDGYAHTWNGDRLWRKTRSEPGPNTFCLCYGVDPNRNWNNHWDSPANGASSSCCNDAFRGFAPFSEVEIVHQRDFVLGIRDVKAYIDIHAYSQFWMYPYGWTKLNTRDESTLKTIGLASVAAISSIHGKSYTTGSIADVIYVATGSTADYFYDEGIKCSFAAELRDTGTYGFLLPESEIIPTAEEAFAGLMVIARNVANGTC